MSLQTSASESLAIEKSTQSVIPYAFYRDLDEGVLGESSSKCGHDPARAIAELLVVERGNMRYLGTHIPSKAG